MKPLPAISFCFSVFEGVHIAPAGKLRPSEETASTCNGMSWSAAFYTKGAVPFNSFGTKLEAPEWFPLINARLPLLKATQSSNIVMKAIISTQSSQNLSCMAMFIHVHFSLFFFELIHITVGIYPVHLRHFSLLISACLKLHTLINYAL